MGTLKTDLGLNGLIQARDLKLYHECMFPEGFTLIFGGETLLVAMKVVLPDQLGCA
jgi:hypothetical protein